MFAFVGFGLPEGGGELYVGFHGGAVPETARTRSSLTGESCTFYMAK